MSPLDEKQKAFIVEILRVLPVEKKRYNILNDYKDYKVFRLHHTGKCSIIVTN